jgi:hypothetical protein
MSLIPVFNKTSPRAHTELELDVLGVHRKLVKYVVHFKEVSIACVKTCLWNVGLLKITSTIGPLSIIGASTLFYFAYSCIHLELFP